MSIVWPVVAAAGVCPPRRNSASEIQGSSKGISLYVYIYIYVYICIYIQRERDILTRSACLWSDTVIHLRCPTPPGPFDRTSLSHFQFYKSGEEGGQPEVGEFITGELRLEFSPHVHNDVLDLTSVWQTLSGRELLSGVLLTWFSYCFSMFPLRDPSH